MSESKKQNRTYRESQWRAPFRPLIEEALRVFRNSEQKFADIKERDKAMRAALDAVYPYRAEDAEILREYRNRRRIWNDEIKRARGLKPPLWTPKRAIDDVRKLIEHERKYGTKQSVERVIAALPWRPAGVS